MTDQGEPVPSGIENDTRLLLELFRRADRLLVKKLSNNDRDWARFPHKHQAGVYIPHQQRDGGFFPGLVTKERGEVGAHAIREKFFTTVWPQESGEPRTTRLVHYMSKGPETHLTRLPKSLFADLLPASYLVMGRVARGAEPAYECLTVDSGSEDAAWLVDLLGIGPDFLVGEFDPLRTIEAERELILDFAEEVITAWLGGTIASFAAANASMPGTAELARMARDAFLSRHAVPALDPFAIPAPGDALREISRSIEWELFRDFQRRERAVALVRIVMGDDPFRVDAAHVIRRLVDDLPEIDRLMLSGRVPWSGVAGEASVRSGMAGPISPPRAGR